VLSTSEWITIVVTAVSAAVAVGILIGRIASVEARVGLLERGNTDGKRRLGELVEAMAVVRYKLFGRRVTLTGADGDPEDKT
jgi:hypothetical protein